MLPMDRRKHAKRIQKPRRPGKSIRSTIKSRRLQRKNKKMAILEIPGVRQRLDNSRSGNSKKQKINKLCNIQQNKKTVETLDGKPKIRQKKTNSPKNSNSNTLLIQKSITGNTAIFAKDIQEQPRTNNKRTRP